MPTHQAAFPSAAGSSTAEPAANRFCVRCGKPRALDDREAEFCTECMHEMAQIAIRAQRRTWPDSDERGVTDAELDRRDGHGWGVGRGGAR